MFDEQDFAAIGNAVVNRLSKGAARRNGAGSHVTADGPTRSRVNGVERRHRLSSAGAYHGAIRAHHSAVRLKDLLDRAVDPIAAKESVTRRHPSAVEVDQRLVLGDEGPHHPPRHQIAIPPDRYDHVPGPDRLDRLRRPVPHPDRRTGRETAYRINWWDKDDVISIRKNRPQYTIE